MALGKYIAKQQATVNDIVKQQTTVIDSFLKTGVAVGS